MSRYFAVIAGALLAGVISGCSPTATPTPIEGEVVSGMLNTPVDFSSIVGSGAPILGEPCQQKEGFTDLGDGTSVTIRDGKGKIVAMGKLGKPKLAAPEGATKTWQIYCQSMFIVSEVPAGRAFYSIEVGNRGQVEVTEEELFGLPLLKVGL